jgi:hypothetical protein
MDGNFAYNLFVFSGRNIGGLLGVKPFSPSPFVFTEGISTVLLPMLAAGTAIALLILTPFWAIRWYRMPFTGALYETNNVVSSINIQSWPATEQGVKYLDRLVALNGETLISVRDFETMIAGQRVRAGALVPRPPEWGSV